MEFVSPIDALFLLAESREHPMHVGGLMLFEPPEDAGPDHPSLLHRRLLEQDTVHPTFRKRPATLLSTPQLGWTRESDIELPYHVRRSALPAPGGHGQLLDLASRLHGSLLDRHRPLWEVHLIEGLADGRFALYTKMHHALIDGVSGQRLLRRAMTEDPASDHLGAPWNPPRTGRSKPERTGSTLGFARDLWSAATSAPALARAIGDALLRQQLTMPFAAPRTMFNAPIGGARRVAVRSWPLERLEQVGKTAGATVNDVVLAMSAGALRRFLTERGALPDKPLIALVPMSLRAPDDSEPGGNKICAILCNLATDLADPVARLDTIRESTRRNKQVYQSLSSTQAMALSALTLSPIVTSVLPALSSVAAPPFNLIISNVPGPRAPLYWGGARLDAGYPLSIPFDGQAVNITLTTVGEHLDFGIVGCRSSVPGMDRILDHLEAGLAELEEAI
ncbi:WS/DGAT/MGAT family O-acyltransferase [Nocardia bovistercoris]|uniref:Diacylglycerol O-acyltransferase n=1 Tax=Nocardia bovistercoris TaxID=2785916 RepID=A0A931IDL7_9NOCA|nr:wax ester/triacylglycerol synthase family O-acyltransferase [Nocardia bovistercoris]MBH0778573.1 wax ester/triacylglycerol synthase family O-acyltransferase [Nocardia bovistercoris]